MDHSKQHIFIRACKHIFVIQIFYNYCFLVQFIPSCQSFFNTRKPKYLKSFKECRPDGHMEFNEGWRNHNRITSDFIKEDDSKLKEGWYRFTNGSFRMLQRNELFKNPFRNRVSKKKILNQIESVEELQNTFIPNIFFLKHLLESFNLVPFMCLTRNA